MWRILFLLICIATSVCIPSVAKADGWKRMYVFGDSYSDSGAGYIDGNGPTWAVYLAQKLGIPFVANGAPDANGKGINFAVSAAQSGEAKGATFSAREPSDPGKKVTMGRGVLTQVKEFQSRVSAEQIQFDPNTTIFIIEAGLNDGKLPTQTTISNIETSIRLIYASGGRNILFTVLPEKISRFADVSKRINPALARIPGELAISLPDANIHLSRWGRYYDQIMDSPKVYGFTNTTDKCAGRRIFNQDATPCGAPAHYFFYTEGHPSTSTHKLVGSEMAAELKLAFHSKNKNLSITK